MRRHTGLLTAAAVAVAWTVQPSAGLGATSPQAAAEAAEATVTSGRALLDRYCVTCHNQRLKTAGLQLDTVELSDVGKDSEIWEKVIRKLRSGSMPPPGRPRPDPAGALALVSSLEARLDRAAAAHPHPGRPTIQRLNRTEYANAVRDLLAVDIDPRSLLPADDSDKHGFDNIGEVLSVSPALLERYLSAAGKISRIAVAATPPTPVSTVYRVPKTIDQGERLSEDLPLGSRGGIAVHHLFPADGQYRLRVRLQRNLYDLIRGLGTRHTLEVRADGALIKQFFFGGEEHGEPSPVAFGGTIDGSPEWEKYAREADKDFEVEIAAKAGTRTITAAFLTDVWIQDEILQPRQTGFGRDTNEMFDGLPAVETLTVDGPYGAAGTGETPSHRKVFTCRPRRAADEEKCAREILFGLARLAYRRPVTDADVEPLLRMYRAGRAGSSWEAGIELALQTLLASPAFLFRIEQDPAADVPGQAYPILDLELASRLSFFLWSTIPDDELLNVAARGQLKDPKVLDRQVRRMLADDRSRALVENFAGQWLVVRNVRDVTPDPDIFPDFDDNLRLAFERETELFIASQIRGDRSILELLTANYSFLNERLARHYRIPNVYGERFRRVTFGEKDHRGGLLGHGSVLTVTSYPNRTSPVLRGKWLLENVLGVPPPEPPPDVPALRENRSGEAPLTVRARLEQHRQNVVCATCHAPMDPLGFALENFDAIGAWRTSDSGSAIDANGELPGSVKFEGVAGLRQVVVTRYRDLFVRTVIEKLLIYALGRAVEHYDMPTVRAIAREAAASDYRWSVVVSGIVKSLPFQMRAPAEAMVKADQ